MIYLVYAGFCLLIALLGRHRKFGFWGYFFCSVFLTPIVGALIMLASDIRVSKVTRCPKCDTRIDIPVIGERTR